MFPLQFRIADVEGFLRIVKLFQKPLLHFDSPLLRVTNADLTAEAVYMPAFPDTTVLPHGNRKRKELPPEHISFRLTSLQWRMLHKVLSIGGLRECYQAAGASRLVFKSDGSTVMATVHRGSSLERQEASVRLDGNPQSQQCRLVYCTTPSIFR